MSDEIRRPKSDVRRPEESGGVRGRAYTDEQLNEAVRSLVDGEPSPGFERRVMARVREAEEHGALRLGRRTASLRAFGWQYALASAAVVVIAAFVWLQTRPVPTSAPIAHKASPQLQSPQPTASSQQPQIAQKIPVNPDFGPEAGVARTNPQHRAPVVAQNVAAPSAPGYRPMMKSAAIKAPAGALPLRGGAASSAPTYVEPVDTLEASPVDPLLNVPPLNVAPLALPPQIVLPDVVIAPLQVPELNLPLLPDRPEVKPDASAPGDRKPSSGKGTTSR